MSPSFTVIRSETIADGCDVKTYHSASRRGLILQSVEFLVRIQPARTNALLRSPLDASRPFAPTSTRSYPQRHAPFDWNVRVHMQEKNIRSRHIGTHAAESSRARRQLLSWPAGRYHFQRSDVSLRATSFLLASSHFLVANGFKVRLLYCRAALAERWKE